MSGELWERSSAVVVTMQAIDASTAAEFIHDELTVLIPGAFKLSTDKLNNTPLYRGDNSVGEYLMDFDSADGTGWRSPEGIYRHFTSSVRGSSSRNNEATSELS
jgi:hypothetical protein